MPKNELYDLDGKLKYAKTGKDFIDSITVTGENKAIQQNNMFYVLGAVDALFYCGKITQQEYTDYYKKYGL